MQELILEALNYYRNIERMTGVILFHVRNNYEAYQDSAIDVAVICDLVILKDGDLSIVRIPEDMLKRVLVKVHNNNKTYHLIEYRNKYGLFDIPKVKQIFEDEDMDY